MLLQTILKKIFGEDSNLAKGVLKANSLPLLPEAVERFNNILIVRIIRVLGGASLLLIFMNKSMVKSGSTSIFAELGLPISILLIIDVLSIIQGIYLVVMFFIKSYYVLYHLKHKNYEIRNSPLNKTASFFGKSFLCLKGICQNTGILGGTIGGFYAVDQILDDSGRDPIFKPFRSQSKKANIVLTKLGWPAKNIPPKS